MPRYRNAYTELCALNKRRNKLVKKLLEECFREPDPRLTKWMQTEVRLSDEILSLEQLAQIVVEADRDMAFAIAEAPPWKQEAMLAAYHDPEFWTLLDRIKARIRGNNVGSFKKRASK
jgi:hypothetical protein